MTRPRVERTDLREQLVGLASGARRAMGFWRTALVVFLVGEIACVAYLLVHAPHFRSETVLLYSEGVRSPDEAPARPRTLATRMKELSTSRRELARTVEEFDLYPDVRASYGMSDAVEELRKHLEFRAPGGNTFTIAFSGDSPEQAQNVTGKLAERVIEQDSELRKEQASATRDFLAGEKKRAEKQLRNAEQDLAGFMAEHPRFALDVMPLATGAAIRASIAAPGLTSKAPRRRLVRVPAREPEPEPEVAKPAPPPSLAVIEAARQHAQEKARAAAAVAAAREDLNQKRMRYTDAHPDVRAAREALARAESRLDAVIRRTPKAPAPVAPVNPATEEDEPKKPSKPRYVEVPVQRKGEPAQDAGTGSADLVALETDWSRLTRNVTEARQRFDQVEISLFRADMVASSTSGDRAALVTVIDPAYLPQRPVPPGPRSILALFFAGSFIMAAIAAIGRALFDDRIVDTRGASELTEVLIEVPRAPKPRRAHA